MYVCCTSCLGFAVIVGLKVWSLFHYFWKILSPYHFKYFLFPIFSLFFSGISVVCMYFLLFFNLFCNFWMFSFICLFFFNNSSSLWVQYQVVSNDLSSSTMLNPLMRHSKQFFIFVSVALISSISMWLFYFHYFLKFPIRLCTFSISPIGELNVHVVYYTSYTM